MIQFNFILKQRRFLLLAAAILLTIVARTGAADLASAWGQTPAKVDSISEDAFDRSTTFLKDDSVSIGLVNDSARLYFLLRFRNPQYARVIRMTGLTLWLDAKGKKNKDFMIKFRGGPSWEEMRSMMGRERRRPQDSSQQENPEMDQPPDRQGRPTEGEFTCFQKDRIVEKPIPEDGSEGPSARFANDNGSFVYILSVPLGESEVRNYGIGTEPGRKISVGMMWGEMPKNTGDRGDRPEGGMEGGFPGGEHGGGFGGSGMRGGMGGGEGRREGGGGQFKRPEKHEVWLNVELASSNTGTK